MKNKFYSKNFVRDLLMIEILQNTDVDNPKTSKQILDEVAISWRKIFPDVPFYSEEKSESEKVTATVTRHIHDMNQSGLYDIKTCRDKRKGYFNAGGGQNFVFKPEEFALIATALYRTPSISTEETQKILDKFKDLISPDGESFNYLLQKQIKYWRGLRRKPARKILPILLELLRAILENKRIKFKLYERNFSEEPKFQKLREGGIRDKVYTVSPYFLVWDNDELYLIGMDIETRFTFKCGRNLSHFKVSLIGDLKILDEDAEVLPSSSALFRYFVDSASLYRRFLDQEFFRRMRDIVLKKRKGKPLTDDEEKELQNFSLDRYMREHIYLDSNDEPIIDVTIYFKEEFLDTFLTRFNLNQRYEPVYRRYYGSYRSSSDNEFEYQARIFVQENDGLYRWLMQYSDQVKVIQPLKVREELQRRYENALKNLNL